MDDCELVSLGLQALFSPGFTWANWMKKKSADKERKGKMKPREDIATTLQGCIKEHGVQVAQSGITTNSSNECVGGLQDAEEVDIYYI